MKQVRDRNGEKKRESERGSREGEKFPVPWPKSRWTGGVLLGP